MILIKEHSLASDIILLSGRKTGGEEKKEKTQLLHDFVDPV